MANLKRERIETFIKVLRNPKEYAPDVAGFHIAKFGWMMANAQLTFAGDDGILLLNPEEPQECGTVCCAMGLAGLAPALKGLTWHISEGFTIEGYNSPHHDYLGGYEAATLYFGIEKDLAYKIFDSAYDYYRWAMDLPDDPFTITPDLVADVLQKLLNGEIPNHA